MQKRSPDAARSWDMSTQEAEAADAKAVKELANVGKFDKATMSCSLNVGIRAQTTIYSKKRSLTPQRLGGRPKNFLRRKYAR